MRFARKITSLILIIALIAPIMPLNTLPVNASSTTQQMPRVALVKLWTVTHVTYSAKFISDDYVLIGAAKDVHIDVSLDGKYVAVDGPSPTAYLYDVKTGSRLKTFTGPGVFDMQGNKLWDRGGFFSGNSKRMIEDVKYYGTDARVVDTETWTTIPVDWGFTETTASAMYACQLDYSGATLVVGYVAVGKLLVYKYDPNQNKYIKVFEHQESGTGYGRRLQMTLDGKYIVVGGPDYQFVDIWRWDGSTYERIAQLNVSDSGGINALGISDPYKIGYIIVGSYNGWVLIAKFNPDTETVSIVYHEKVAPDGTRFYNPFYDRWIPKITEVFVITGRNQGYGVVYDVLTNTTQVITYPSSETEPHAAGAVSPTSSYVFIGDSLYMVVKRDVQSKYPRVRFWGSMEFHREYQSLSNPLILKAPAKDWHLYFYSGKVTIKRVYVEPVPVDLVEDPDIIQGRLAKMHEKGLTSAEVLYTENTEVKELEIIPGTEVKDILISEGLTNPENYLATVSLLHFVPPPYFWEGHAWYGSVIHIPLDKPINVYDDMVMQLSTSVHTSTLLYDKNKRALGVIGIPVELGGGVGIGATAYSKIAWKVLEWYALRHGVSVGKIAAVATSQSVAKVAGIVGIAVAVWGGIDAALVEWGGFGDINTQDWIVIAPTVVDEQGNKYSAIKLVLPLEESENIETYYNRILKYFKDLGYVDVGLSVDYPCRTWDEYKALLAAGYAPQVRLDTLIEETIASKYGLDVNKLKIEGVDVFVITATKAKETFWEWLFGLGGVDADTVTLIGAATITVKGKLKAGTITDPSQIAALLGKVVINGIDFELKPGADGAYTEFAFNLGVESLTLDFGKREGYYADMVIASDVLVKKDFQPLEDFGYTTTLHYDWEDTLIRIERIEFTDMPYKMLKAERIFVYAYGNFTNDITEAFELTQVIFSDLSPTGEFYYYITRENTKFIDPANGGIMQPCKTYIFNYYYRQPPDAGIMVLLNGTKITSTLAHHATVLINSTAEQEVTYSLTFNVKYYEGITVKTLISRSLTDKMAVLANGTAYKTFDITPYVDAAINFMKSQNKTAFVEITAKIIEAKYNYYKDNDEYTVVYYPPLSLPSPLPGGNFTVTFEVLDAVNYTAIPGATIVAAYGENITESSLVYTVTTNESGRAQLVLQGGVWTFKASKDGYYDAFLTAPIYNDTLIRFYLVPSIAENFTQPILPINGSTTPIIINNTPYFWLGVQVLWANGLPFEGANVSVYKNATGELIATLTTNGTGMAWYLLPAYEVYNITVHAVNPYNTSLVYDASRVLNLTAHTIISFNVTWTPEVPELAKKYYMVVYAYDALTNQPIGNVTVIVAKGQVGYLQLTNASGIAEFYLPFLGKWTVIGLHPDYDAANRTIELFENETTVNLPMYPKNITMPVLPPVNGTYPPVVYQGENYYWLSVQVLWKDGYPFCGANVSVYNATDGSLMFQRYTNGTGFVHFLIPENASIKVTVNATHPEDPALTFYDERELNMTQHWYVVFTVPWESKYYQPEVWLKELHFVIHRGQGYFFGNVSHLVLLKIWTNKPQNVTVLIGLYNVTGGTWVSNKTVTLSLVEGINSFFEWVDVNASTGGYFKVFANITSWEYDTDPTNNWLWSEEQFLKPMVDIQVFVLWRPIEQKQSWSLLPEDVIEVDIGIRLPINTTTKPAKLEWRVEKYNLMDRIFDIERGAEEEVRVVQPGTVWRNVTIVVPWTSKIVVLANVTHEWEDFGYNNYVNVTIEIDPDVKIELVEKPSFIMEGQVFKVVVNVTSNVEPGGGIGWVSLIDNTTATLLKRVEITLEPMKTVELEAKAPENPTVFWIFRAPSTTHDLTTQFVGYDLYLGNNKQDFKLIVTSYQWLTIIAIIVVIIAVLAAIRAVTHTAFEIREKSKKFVKRKTSFLAESIEDLREQFRFVKKKKRD